MGTSNPQSTTVTPPPYAAKDYSFLLGLPGFSDNLLKNHFTLYQGYVSNTNGLLAQLAQMSAAGQGGQPQYAELKRRLGWEFNGMRLHEYYFENLGQGQPLQPGGKLAEAINASFGSYEAWLQDFQNTALMRGIGWVILYQDPLSGRLINFWVNEHDVGHPAGGTPLLVLDVFEHAYLTDYGIVRKDYVTAACNAINWQVVEKRFG